jgi:hypothetical protein
MTLEKALIIPLSCLKTNLLEPRFIKDVNLIPPSNQEKALLSTPTI